MITFYTGIPRSGKTLKTVYDIYHEFIFDKKTITDKIKSKLGKEEEKEEKYLHLCTNINKFNFDLSDKFYKLNFQDLYKDLKSLYDMYILNKSDDEIIEQAKELKLYKVLFVFDECHNFFKDKKDDVLVWWLTYHGHIYHEIILITQDMSLLSKEYKTQGEQFYKAIPQTYRLSKNVFKYSLYSSYNMYQKDFIKSITIKPQKEIFDMYVSGDTVNSKSIFHKYIYIFIALLISCVFSFMFLIDSFSNDVEETPNTVKNIDTPENGSLDSNSESENENTKIYDEEVLNYKYMTLKCSLKYKYCLYKNKKMQLSTYYKLKDIFGVEELSITEINNGFVQLDILAKPTFYNIFNGGLENENNSKNTTMSNNIFSNN